MPVRIIWMLSSNGTPQLRSGQMLGPWRKADTATAWASLIQCNVALQFSLLTTQTTILATSIRWGTNYYCPCWELTSLLSGVVSVCGARHTVEAHILQFLTGGARWLLWLRLCGSFFRWLQWEVLWRQHSPLFHQQWQQYDGQVHQWWLMIIMIMMGSVPYGNQYDPCK